MADRPSNDAKQAFLTKLASNAKLLSDFIKNPDKVMKKHRISEKDRCSIRTCLALEITKKLLICPDGMHVHWGN